MNKKVVILSAFLMMGFSFQTFADEPQVPPLNVISFQLQADQWVNTNQAKVIVNFNGSVVESDLAAMRNAILGNLNQLSKTAEWHITNFQRSQDSSGLEKVLAQAEARLSNTELTNLRKIAKAISKPGQTYEIADIQFTPSVKDIESVRGALRTEIYTKAKSELEQFNKLYPNQHYQLHKIEFAVSNAPMSTGTGTNNFLMATKMVDAAPAPMNVSNKVYAIANIEFASELNEHN